MVVLNVNDLLLYFNKKKSPPYLITLHVTTSGPALREGVATKMGGVGDRDADIRMTSEIYFKHRRRPTHLVAHLDGS